MPIIAGPGDPGTTLHLDRLWINVLADPTVVRSFRVRSFKPGKTVNGTVRQLAGDRLRWVKSSGKPRRASAVLVMPSQADRDWLDEWAGELVIVRDPDGGKLIGVYPDIEWDRPVQGADIAVAFQQITASEAV